MVTPMYWTEANQTLGEQKRTADFECFQSPLRSSCSATVLGCSRFPKCAQGGRMTQFSRLENSGEPFPCLLQVVLKLARRLNFTLFGYAKCLSLVTILYRFIDGDWLTEHRAAFQTVLFVFVSFGEHLWSAVNLLHRSSVQQTLSLTENSHQTLD